MLTRSSLVARSELTRIAPRCSLAFLILFFVAGYDGVGGVDTATEAKPAPGLVVTVTSDNESDVIVLPDVAWFVAADEPATPFLPTGKFTAVWQGNVQAELRGSYLFQATLSGALKLEINGKTALQSDDTGAPRTTPLSDPVTLNKGLNALKATWTAPTKAHSFIRLGWTEKGTNVSPMGPAILSHSTASFPAERERLHRARELFLDHRCFHCHGDPALEPGRSGTELGMDAPALAGIGARRHFEWLTRWILDPRSVRPTAQMPRLLHGATAAEDAMAIAAYLSSLRDGSPFDKLRAGPLDKVRPGPPAPSTVAYQTRQVVTDDAGAGASPAPNKEARPLYERLRCAACHNPPDAKEIDPNKLSQKGVGTKFPKGRLAEYLRAPEGGYAWTRMPNFHLTEAEANELEDYLLRTSTPPKEQAAPDDPKVLEKGRDLIQSKGCLNCHTLPLENRLKAPALAALRDRQIKKRSQIPAGDCLGGAPFADFGFGADDKAALNEFTRVGVASLGRMPPSEFADRQARQLKCAACHGQIEQVPPLEILGGKLNPEWAARFIAGEIPHKMRFDNHPKGEVWVEARMPAYRNRGAFLARGLAALHGYPPATEPESPLDPVAAEIGRKLVGKDGGLSCTACHAVGPVLALGVFESEGLNLAMAADRLLPDYYRRWFRNPLSIDPQSKMPMYFDEDGGSPLVDILAGNGDAQMNAVWHYFRQRERMAQP